MTNKYIGHENQIYGVEEYRLQGTKGDGMRFLTVRNGKGLEPGNCHPDGRDVMRKQGLLEFLAPDESKTHIIKFNFTEEK